MFKHNGFRGLSVDYISSALAKSGIPAALGSAKQLVEALAGPAAGEAGLFLQDQVRGYRLRNQLSVLGKTQTMLKNAGIEPKSVPLRVLVPLLEGAALEDDENLSTKWAALLANAAAQGGNVNLIPSFANILSQLSPRDAAILDRLSKEKYYHASRPGYIQVFAFRATLQEPLKLSDKEYDLSVDNIVRLGLCVADNQLLPDTLQQILKPLEQWKMVTRDELIATQLGMEFLNACSSPQGKTAKGETS